MTDRNTSQSPRPSDFAPADLLARRPARTAPKSARALGNVPDADASGMLEELSADDILESDDIDELEAAAANIPDFLLPSDPSGFEVGDVGAFDEVEVEGAAHVVQTQAATAPAQPSTLMGIAAAAPVRVAVPVPVPAPVAAAAPVATAAPADVAEVSEPVPASMKIEPTSLKTTTLVGVPAAPITSRLPVDIEESVIISEPRVEKTLELRGNDLQKVAAAAAALANEPDQTQVLVRSAMPAALQRGQARPAASLSPQALDVAALPRPGRMPSVPAAAMPMHGASRGGMNGMSGLVIGGIACAAFALVALVGVGGYAASRALSDKPESATVTSAESVAGSETAAAAAAPSEAPPAPAQVDPAPAVSSPIDVSSLPSAPVPGAAPHGFTGSGSFVAPNTPTPPPVVAEASPAPAAVPAAPSPAAAPAPVARSSGGALPAPGGGSGKNVTSSAAGAPLPPPASAPAAAAAPAANAASTSGSSTGTVRVDPALRAVVVDGSYRRANDGVLTVSCGTHRIKAGMKDQQTVNVPCGGSVSL